MPDSKYNCRPSCLFGSWFIDPETLDSLEEHALSIVQSGQLEPVASATRDQVDEQASKPYVVDRDGIATFSATGPLTKYPSSFQSALGGTSYLMLQHAIGQALKDPEVKGAMLIADSPGGTILGAAECAKAISRFAAKKPFHVHVQGSGTSAMYWLGIQGSFISADPTSTLGNVGAFSVLTDRTKQLANMGITKHLVTNPGADKKGIGVDGVPVTEAHRKELSSMLGDLTEPFINDVKKRRDLPDSVMDEVKRAGVYVGKKGFEVGLVDAIGYTDAAYEYLRETITGVKSAQPDDSGFEMSDQQSKGADMPVTAEQLTRIQKVNGLQAATADNAVDVLLSAIDAANASLTESKAAVAASTTKITALEADLVTAKAASAPKAATPREKELLGQLAKSHRDEAVRASIAPATLDAIQAAFPDDPETHSKVFKALAGNVASPKTGEQTAAQIVPDPNKAADVGKSAEAEAKAWQESQVRSRGLAAV